jgi:DNA-directed RNA polymerase subunit RPC12/RpoP
MLIESASAVCPVCGRLVTFHLDKVGDHVKCRGCGFRLRVNPDSGEPQEPPESNRWFHTAMFAVTALSVTALCVCWP